jgi:hypothetical protein
MVRLIHAGDAFGEHGLPGPVVSAQRGHESCRKVEVDSVKSLDGAEVIFDASHLEQGLGRCGCGGRVFDHLRHSVILRLEMTPPRTLHGGANSTV